MNITRIALTAALGLFLGKGAFSEEAGWVRTQTISPLSAPVDGDARSTNGKSSLAVAAERAPQVPAGQLFDLQVLLKPSNPVPSDSTAAAAAARKARFSAKDPNRFAPSQAQVDSVVSYLRQNGFTHIEAAPNRFSIRAQGTIANVSKAFRVGVKTCMYEGRPVFANDDTVQVPANLGAIVGNVLGLQNIY